VTTIQYIEEEQTTQGSKVTVLKYKQQSTNYTHKTKDRVTRTPLKKPGWTQMRLEERRTDARFVVMHKISYDEMAVSKSDGLETSSPRHSSNMHSRSYQVPLCTTQQRKASFSPRIIVDWNCLPQTAVLRGCHYLI
jgi:hypothetical protein